MRALDVATGTARGFSTAYMLLSVLHRALMSPRKREKISATFSSSSPLALLDHTMRRGIINGITDPGKKQREKDERNEQKTRDKEERQRRKEDQKRKTNNLNAKIGGAVAGKVGGPILFTAQGPPPDVVPPIAAPPEEI